LRVVFVFAFVIIIILLYNVNEVIIMATKQERIDSLKAQLSKIEERKKEIAGKIRNLNKPTKTERKARTHRLCTIGGLVEKYAGRDITDLKAFEEWIATQTKWIKG